MAVSRRSILAVCGITGATGLLVGLALAPAAAGSAPAAALAGGCSATAHVDAQWGSGATGGQVVTFTVANTSATTATKWTVTWTLAEGQQVVSAWNAIVSTADGTATAANAAYNGVLAPGASTSFGAQLSGPASVPAPSCGNDAPSPVPASSVPTSGVGVTVTVADNLGTTTLHVGDTLVVSLPSDYLPPKVTSAGVLVQQDVVGGYPTAQPLVARYVATAPGKTDVSTTTDTPCNHDPTPCPSPGVPWTVHVTVTA